MDDKIDVEKVLKDLDADSEAYRKRGEIYDKKLEEYNQLMERKKQEMSLAAEQPPFAIKFNKEQLEKWFARAIYLGCLLAVSYFATTWAATKLQVTKNTQKIEVHDMRINTVEKRLDDKDTNDKETLKVLYKMQGTLEVIEKRTR